MVFKVTNRCFAFIVCFFLFIACKKDLPRNYQWKTIEVNATAYNSLVSQTDGSPFITAFGDSLKPGLKYIAVSRDLLKLGLKHNTLVKVDGLEGTYLVKDKMHSRWRNKIDIYMGTDVNAAKKWGRRKINISYRLEIFKDSIED